MTDDTRHVRYDAEGGFSQITLDRPHEGNALSSVTIAQLLTAIRRALAEEARVIILRATGRFFCVGGDLHTFAAADDLSVMVDDLAEGLHRVVSELVRSRAVVVAVVQGPAAGAGVSLAAAADLVIASSESSFTLAYTSVGLSPDGGSTLLVHTLGLHRVLRMALLNESLSASEAMAAGLVARVVPPAELEAAVSAVIGTLIGGSAPALAGAKALLREVAESHPESAMRRETLSIRSTAGGDGIEGVRAFLEKRSPRFGR